MLALASSHMETILRGRVLSGTSKTAALRSKLLAMACSLPKTKRYRHGRRDRGRFLPA
jgi:hypothetical protein